jgi:hypothetical protein
MIHAAVAVAAVLLFALVGLSPWAGALAAAALYAGREHAQAEQRIIEAKYNNWRQGAPWWCGFEPAAWNRKAVLDLLLPVLAGAGAATIF